MKITHGALFLTFGFLIVLSCLKVTSSEEEEEEDPEDVNNGGAHIDDVMNIPDAEGRVKINLGHPTDEADIYLAPQIAQSIKPHQVRVLSFFHTMCKQS